jgi:hypothetical protein
MQNQNKQLLVAKNGIKSFFVSKVIHIKCIWNFDQVVTIEPLVHLHAKPRHQLNYLLDVSQVDDITYVFAIHSGVAVESEHVNMWHGGKYVTPLTSSVVQIRELEELSVYIDWWM